jgi:hypothetical protein
MNSLHFILAIGLVAAVWFGRDQQLKARKSSDNAARTRRAYVKLDNDYQALWQAHEIALEDCQAIADALQANMLERHPATRHLTIVREG